MAHITWDRLVQMVRSAEASEDEVRHLHRCPRCRDRLEQLREAKSLLSPPSTPSRELLSWALAYATGAAPGPKERLSPASFLSPAAGGAAPSYAVRAAGPGQETVATLLRSGDVTVDLRLQELPSGRWLLEGEVLVGEIPASQAEVKVVPIEPEGAIFATYCDETGLFQLGPMQPSRFSLTVQHSKGRFVAPSIDPWRTPCPA